jgi:hypothetical protein
MSSIETVDHDVAALPTALLGIAKSHMRINGSTDDEYIKLTIARAIDWFERVTNVSVNPVTYTWHLDAVNFCNGAATVPESPVAADFTVKDAGGDKTSSYSVTTMSTHGVGIYSLRGAYADGLAMTFKSGYADLAAIDAGVLDAVLRYGSHLYENREILVPGSQASTPGWMTDVISTYWMPRV